MNLVVMVLKEIIFSKNIFWQKNQLRAKKIINSLEGTLDFKNYNAILLPSDKEYLTIILSKTTKNNPPKTISWTNEQPTKVGKQNAVNVIKSKGDLIN